MATITIDGKQCEFDPADGKKMILQVALDNGFEIPHYCYHPGLSVVASCRICLAEVEAPNPRNEGKVELIPKLVPTCQTPAADGQVVHLTTPKAIANQKAVMEYLLLSHPLDCPVCDQAGECYLQDYSYKYGRSVSRYEETKIKQPKKDVGPDILLYSDRCIMCTRCVRFTREVSGTDELGVYGRGAMEQIDIFPGKPLDNPLAGNVVDICPVGALLDKDFLMSMRVWNLRKTASIDGVTASGDNISLEHNDGRIYRLKPRTNMDVNKWWISDEIRFGWKFVHDERRLRSPMQGGAGSAGGSKECDWNQAYGVIRQGVEGKPLALLVSPMLTCEEAYALGKWAARIDENAVIGVGPIPIEGEDQTFPGGYTIYAEKCPNSRGVRRALGQITDEVLSYEDWIRRVAEPASAGGAVVLTGNYPSEWVTDELAAAVADRFTVLIDTLPNRLSEQVDVLLPGATWTEKTGTFENVHGRLQSFDQAIPVIELAKPEGQIAMDLFAACGLAEKAIFDPARLRVEMGDAFASEVHHPPHPERAQSDLEYVEL